eukprot:scaffold11297_cov140-Amphora_coffeaeformis.AAC.2
MGILASMDSPTRNNTHHELEEGRFIFICCGARTVWQSPPVCTATFGTLFVGIVAGKADFFFFAGHSWTLYRIMRYRTVLAQYGKVVSSGLCDGSPWR